MKKPLITELTERGLIYQTSGRENQLSDYLESEKRVIYHGFDPTADSLHIGHLVPLLLMRKLQRAGHTIVLLAGGATGMIGDPSGKSQERVVLDKQTLQKNAESIVQQVQHIFRGVDIQLVNNYDWFSSINTLDYLRDIGKYVSVHGLLKRDSVQLRLNNESFFSYTEFSYSLIQGYDFVHLSRSHLCTVQVGGGDQWGNMLMGIEMAHKIDSTELFALSCPLLINSKTGKKFGKSESGALWLSPEKTSPYEMYQFCIQVDDTDVERFMNIFSDYSDTEIAEIMYIHNEKPEQRYAQKKLAFSITEIVHSTIDAQSSQSVSGFLFGEKSLSELTQTEMQVLAKSLQNIDFDPGISILDTLVSAGIASSKRSGRELIESGAVSINNEKITDENYTLADADFRYNICLLRKGKREYFAIVKK
jgi:tyrosyl-tRNA synthetase